MLEASTDYPQKVLSAKIHKLTGFLTGGLSNIHDLIRLVKVISPPVRLVRAVRVVEQCLTSRAVGELHVIGETWGLFQVVLVVLVVRVVKQ